MAGVNWDKLSKASQGAALAEAGGAVTTTGNGLAEQQEKGKVGRPTLSAADKMKFKTKSIRYPVILEAEYKALKDTGRAAANFNDFIVQAVREKLDKDTQ